MTIKFQKEYDREFPKHTFIAYNHLGEHPLYFLNQQMKWEFFCFKGAGIFFFGTLVSLFLHNKEMIHKYFVAIRIIGIGCLIMFTQKFRRDFEYCVKAGSCVEKGFEIERKCKYPPKLFCKFENKNLFAYRGYLLSRLFFISLIGLATIYGKILLVIKAGVLLIVSVSRFNFIFSPSTSDLTSKFLEKFYLIGS